jgi:ankyrin repeat protein
MVQLLLDNEADPNQKAKYGGTALHQAATRGHVAVMQLLMKASADINAEDNYGGTVLHRALKKGHEEVVILLIDAGANFSKPHSYEVVTRLLIKTGDDIFREMSKHSSQYMEYNEKYLRP